jgi:DNA-directed RNA polymerase specialized sigma subunit
MERTDHELITAYLQGNDSALEVLVTRYFKLIYNFIYHFFRGSSEIEDLTQLV